MRYFFFLFFVLLFACGENSNSEFEKLKTDLFKVRDEAGFPIYADPPTGDYEQVKKGVFAFRLDSTQLVLVNKYRKELEPLILQYLDSGDSWVYLVAYLKYESAVPKLKQLLLVFDNFYGWEGGDYYSIDDYLEDKQYCYQMVYVASIEYITQKPLNEAITLTNAEVEKLSEKSRLCIMSDSLDTKNCAARWLLLKFYPEPCFLF